MMSMSKPCDGKSRGFSLFWDRLPACPGKTTAWKAVLREREVAMDIAAFDDVREFQRRAEPVLAQREAEYRFE